MQRIDMDTGDRICEKMYDEAIELQDRGEYERAVDIFLKVSEGSTDVNLKNRSKFHVGEIRFVQRKYSLAREIFRSILDEIPAHGKCKYYLNWMDRYEALDFPKIIKYTETSDSITDYVENSLKDDVKITHLSLSVEEFEDYLKEAEYTRFEAYNSAKAPFFREKALEHFTALKLLQLEKEDIFVDIAAAGSPVYKIFREMYGCRTYRQDLSYPSGINGDVIGGDASAMDVDDESFSKLALHCSFEHFEGNRDSSFVKEAIRVLKPGGKLVILPLYINQQAVIKTDPGIWRENSDLSVFQDSMIYCSSNWSNYHGRFYSPESFKSRVLKYTEGYSSEVFILDNNFELDQASYLKFIFVMTKDNE